MKLQQKLSSYMRRLRWEWQQRRERHLQKRNRKRFKTWLRAFRGTDAELLIGANFDASGGVRNHIHSIHRYTELCSELVPSENHRIKVPIDIFEGEATALLDVPPSPAVNVLHSHVSPWFVNWCRLHHSSKVRWVHTHHLLYYDDTELDGLPDWQRKLNVTGLQALRDCDIPLVVSKSQQRELQRLDIQAHYLPNGVDVVLCDAANANRFRRSFRVNEKFVLWLGRNERVKNPRDLLMAAAALPDVRFVMAGGRCTANELLESTGIPVPPNVLLTGALARNVAQDALAACDLLCVTSLREGLPTLILEAMAHGRKIVTSDAEGCLDATDGDAFAMVYTRGDVAGLCSAIQRALRQGHDGSAARARVLQEFDWRVVARRLDSIYRGESV